MANIAHQRENYNINDLFGARLAALAKYALPVGIVGLFMWLVGLVIAPRTAFSSYLFAFMFWFGVTLGSLAWLMGHHVVGGGWGFILRRPLEAATRNFPIVACMFGPILAAMWLSSLNGHAGLYEWADADLVRHDKILTAKSDYLNPIFWTIRAVFYFAVWFYLAHIMNYYSRKEDQTDDPMVRHKLNLWAAGGLVVYVITLTFAAMDWVMALEPHWVSSLFGVIFLVGQGQATLALFVVLIQRLAGDTAIIQGIEKRYFRDIGNLMLAFTLLWGYMNFSQWMIMYSANIAEEAEWFVHRTTYGWEWIGFLVILTHFALPFAFLLMSLTKTNINNLAKLAAFLIVVRHLDLFFYVAPTFRPNPFSEFPISLLTDIGAPLALGGIWLWGWANQMQKNATVVPAYDQRLDGYWPLPDLKPQAQMAKEAASHG